MSDRTFAYWNQLILNLGAKRALEDLKIKPDPMMIHAVQLMMEYVQSRQEKSKRADPMLEEAEEMLTDLLQATPKVQALAAAGLGEDLEGADEALAEDAVDAVGKRILHLPADEMAVSLLENLLGMRDRE